MRLFVIVVLALPLAAQVTPKEQVCNSSGSLCAPVTANGVTMQGAGVAGTPAGGVGSVQGVAGGTALPISAASLPLPSGAATAAKQPAIGTAGTPSADVISVQGVAGGTPQPVSGTVTITPSGTQAVSNAGTFAVQNTAATPAGSAIIGKVGIDQTTPGTTNLVALAANQSINVAQVGGAAPDPCFGLARTFFSISQTTNTQIITGTSAKKIYFCSFNVVGADAENISVVEGTGSVCGTATIAVPGFPAATAAAGWNFAANGGLAANGGGGSMAGASVNADNVCLFQSGSGRVAGGGSYVVQ